MMRNRLLLMVVLITLSLCASSPVFADDFETTIEAFEYNGYEIPAYDGDSSEQINGNLPTFSAEELTDVPSVYYGDLDELGRCTPAFAELNQSLMPTGARGSIASVKPSGWVQAQYDVVPGGWLWNRCHLIGWQLTGADLSTLTKKELSKNLITGTRFLNVGDGSTGMVEYESDVAEYLKEDAEHFVSYRVTPVFREEDLVASGVLMEGQSVASGDVEFCVFCYNVQPEIAINYATGESRLASALPENKSISDCIVTFGANPVFSGQEVTVPITVTDGDAVLQEGLDYQLVFSSNILPGRATVQIVGIGSYKGIVDGSFVIVPAKAAVKSLKLKKKSIRIEAKPQEGVSGYQYSWRIKGHKWKSVSCQGKTHTLKKLKSKTKYQIRLRAYKTIDGEKTYGNWSTVKTVKTK